MTEVKKDEEVVATANSPVNVLLPGGIWDGVANIALYFFKEIKLSPMVTFAHLSGRSLSSWLDKCSIITNGVVIDNLRYVHGRSEVMKGKHRISLVVLASPTFDKEVPEHVWMSYLPEIYRRFLLALE